jgi:ABC-type Mn2+/Zn2+ transport system ATPase subunit
MLDSNGIKKHETQKVQWHIPRSQISYVPQALDFDFHIPLTVREFLEISQIKSILTFPWPWIRKPNPHEDLGSDCSILCPLSEDLLNSPLSELSRGQIQAVILNRAYLEKPSCVLLDEPLTGLDRERRAKVIQNIFYLTESLFMVAHDSDWKTFGFTHVLPLTSETVPKIHSLADFLRSENSLALSRDQS